MPHVIEYAEGLARMEVGVDGDTITIWAAPLPYSKPAKLYFRLTLDEAEQLRDTLSELIEGEKTERQLQAGLDALATR